LVDAAMPFQPARTKIRLTVSKRVPRSPRANFLQLVSKKR
jgi:hypothetical protein